MTTAPPQSPIEIARSLVRQRRAVVPIPHRSKNPGFKGWQDCRLAEEDLPMRFTANDTPQNIGVLLGEPSHGLLDVDLDSPEAVTLAPEFLPRTGAVFGRASKPRSHWEYSVTDAVPATKKYQDPLPVKTDPTHAMLVELRSTGCQTVWPGSTHPSGEAIRWDDPGEPAEVTSGELSRQVARLAAAALLARVWPNLARHDTTLPLAGALLRAGWPVAEVAHFVGAVARCAGDSEVHDRVAVVRDTARRLDAGESVTGIPRLREVIDERVVSTLAQWLALGAASQDHEQPSPADTHAEDMAAPWLERGELPPPIKVPALDPTLLPAGMADYVVDCAHRASIPLEYIAIPLIVGLATVVGRAVGIYPEKFNDWLVVPNLWGGIIGPPGWLKSLALSEGMRPLKTLADEAYQRAQDQENENEPKRHRYEAEIEGIRATMRDTAKREASAKPDDKKATGGASLDTLQAQLADRKKALDALTVIERRYITHDTTTQKLGELLQNNSNGLLVQRDELAGWLQSFGQQGREGDREFYLEAWNGTGSFVVDRIGRGTKRIEALIVSVLGTIQPGKLMPLVEGAIAGGSEADGLLQRLQLLVWPDHLGAFVKPATWPDKAAREQVMAIFRALDNVAALLPPTAYKEGQEIPALHFADDAQVLFDTWRAELEARLRSGALHAAPAFDGHLSKYRSLMPSLALLFHLVEVACKKPVKPAGGVSRAAAGLAAAWCAYLEAHAEKVYAVERHPGDGAGRALAEKIRAGAILDGQTVRTIYRHQWSGLTTPQNVSAGLAVLEALHWVRVSAGPVSERGGQPADVIRLHPDLQPKKGAVHAS